MRIAAFLSALVVAVTTIATGPNAAPILATVAAALSVQEKIKGMLCDYG